MRRSNESVKESGKGHRKGEKKGKRKERVFKMKCSWCGGGGGARCRAVTGHGRR